MGVSGTVNKHLCSGGPDVSLSGAHSPGSSRHAQRPRLQHCRRESRSEIPSKVLPSPPPVSLIALLLGAAGSHTGQESGKSSPPPSLLSPIPKYKGVLADSLGGPLVGRGWRQNLSFPRTRQGRMVPELWDSHCCRRPRQQRVTPTLGVSDETRPRENLLESCAPAQGPGPFVPQCTECSRSGSAVLPSSSLRNHHVQQQCAYLSVLELGQDGGLDIFTPNPPLFCNAKNTSDTHEIVTKPRPS